MSELDQIFREFAKGFVGAMEGGKPICYPEKLAIDKLDLSLASLKFVDKYLKHLHRHVESLLEEEWQSTVLYGGAYVGEVIRNETDNYYRWIDYDDYMADYPDMRAMIPERTVATCAFLIDDDGNMSMPLNKIARFIDEGEENSVHFFAQCDIANAKNA